MRKLFFDFWYKCVVAPIWQTMRRIVYNRSRGRCSYCCQTITADTFTVDHVVPKALGGSNFLSNLVAACKYCNKIKADKPISGELMVELQQRAQLRGRNNRANSRHERIC